MESKSPSKPNISTLENFLVSISPALLKYRSDFEELDFTSTTSLKFFRECDFSKFRNRVSETHKRMIMYGVDNLPTPLSKNRTDQKRSPDTVVGSSRGRISKRLFRTRSPRQRERRPSRHREPPRDASDVRAMAESDTDDDSEWGNYTWQSPSELMMEAIQGEISEMELELSEATRKYDSLNNRYRQTDQRREAGQKKCTNCHLYGSHDKRKCPFPTCVTVEQCGSLGDHPMERKEITSANEIVCKLKTDLKKKKSALELKKTVYEATATTFYSRVYSTLLNSNKRKYLMRTSSGIMPRTAMIKEDCAILEKHYKGKVPENIAQAGKTFQTVIDNFNSKHNRADKYRPGSRLPDPIQEMLKQRKVQMSPGRSHDRDVTAMECEAPGQTNENRRVCSPPKVKEASNNIHRADNLHVSTSSSTVSGISASVPADISPVPTQFYSPYAQYSYGMGYPYQLYPYPWNADHTLTAPTTQFSPIYTPYGYSYVPADGHMHGGIISYPTATSTSASDVPATVQPPLRIESPLENCAPSPDSDE